MSVIPLFQHTFSIVITDDDIAWASIRGEDAFELVQRKFREHWKRNFTKAELASGDDFRFEKRPDGSMFRVTYIPPKGGSIRDHE